jgi:hypothetical protein
MQRKQNRTRSYPKPPKTTSTQDATHAATPHLRPNQPVGKPFLAAAAFPGGFLAYPRRPAKNRANNSAAATPSNPSSTTTR